MAAVFGGSNLQVERLTGAMTVVLVPVVHEFGTSGVLMVGVLAGAVLVAMAVTGLALPRNRTARLDVELGRPV